MSAPLPPDEHARLARLHDLAVLDTAAEPLFDALTRAAAWITGRPIALISLVDQDRQWFKSNVGLDDIRQTPREMAFCAYTILGDELLEVADTTADQRFAGNPMVRGEPALRFYAGAPITLSDGLRMGSLCVIDREPGQLSTPQRNALQQLARAAAEALEQRARLFERNQQLEREAEAAARLQQQLRESQDFLDRTGRAAGVGGWQLDLTSHEVRWSDETCRIHDLPAGSHPGYDEAVNFYPPTAQPVIRNAVETAITTGKGWDLELPLVTAQGRELWVHAVGNVEYLDGQPRRLVGALQDITLRRRATAAMEASERRFRNLFQYSLGLICTHDLAGVLLSVNPAAAHSLGYSTAELMGLPLQELVTPAHRPAFADYLLRVRQQGTDTGMLHLLARDGSARIWRYQNVLDEADEEPYVLGHAQDITDQQRNERRLRELAERDPLTGCYNRRALGALTQSLAAQDSYGCIMFDLDRFKQVNDTYGHQRGDEVLIGMVRFLNGHLRPQDAVVRMGGDEFLVFLPQADASTTDAVAQRFNDDRARAPIGFSMGMATRRHGQSLDEVLADADAQLYALRAKIRGCPDLR